jgi:Flp pilus assembly pilin Flp
LLLAAREDGNWRRAACGALGAQFARFAAVSRAAHEPAHAVQWLSRDHPFSKEPPMQKLRTQTGQGMTEYIIIVALIAVAAIGVYTAFGKTVRGQMAVTAQALAGKSTSTARSVANEGGTDAQTQAGRDVKLDNYDQLQ